MGNEKLTPYQRQFLISRRFDPDSESSIRAASAGVIPRSAEDMAHRHLLGSTFYALEVVTPLKQGNSTAAENELSVLRQKVREHSETLAYEALMKLLALDVITDTLEGLLQNLPADKIDKAFNKLQELKQTPQPR